MDDTVYRECIDLLTKHSVKVANDIHIRETPTTGSRIACRFIIVVDEVSRVAAA